MLDLWHNAVNFVYNATRQSCPSNWGQGGESTGILQKGDLFVERLALLPSYLL